MRFYKNKICKVKDLLNFYYLPIHFIEFKDSCGMATTDRCIGILPSEGSDDSSKKYLMEVSIKCRTIRFLPSIWIMPHRTRINITIILLYYIANQGNRHGCTLPMVLFLLLFQKLQLVDVWWNHPVLRNLFWAARGALRWLLWVRFL